MNPTHAQAPAFQESDLKNISDMISSFVGNNKVAISELPTTLSQIISTYNQIRVGGIGLAETSQIVPVAATAVNDDAPTPAVPVNKSIKHDYIICLLDGGRFKSLKKHLKTKYNLTPAEYREKFNLKADYPMVAPSYSLARSALAKASGLGRTTHERLGKGNGRKATTARRPAETVAAPTKRAASVKSTPAKAKATTATKRSKTAA